MRQSITNKKKSQFMMGNIMELYQKIDFEALENVITNKQAKERYLIDMIDSIFDEEVAIDRNNLQKIKKDISSWAKENKMPYNV